MLFNSFLYIFLFVPLVFFGYFLLAKHFNFFSAKVYLIIASFFFYGWWNVVYLPLLFVSICINYVIAIAIRSFLKNNYHYSYIFLILGILFNICLLAYFKYTNFFIDNLNLALNSNFQIVQIILPLGISFFTFTQIAFLIDNYKNKAKEYGFLNYCLFVGYFPHLLAGPIIHHGQMMPQFANKQNAIINYKNIYFGLIIFVIGLTKKVVVADTFAIFANDGYSHLDKLNFISAWITSLAYTFQIYFDFSGYTDMAIGISKLFNIELPINFNSPYKSLSVREFWHRWHITLSNFLRDYLYIPLGGNKCSNLKIYRNLIVTFIIGGFWHGAGWTFIFWGLLHGVALSLQRAFGKLNIILPKIISWFLTFNFINITWIFFRSKSINEAFKLLSKMFFLNYQLSVNPLLLCLLMVAFSLTLFFPNSMVLIERPIANKLLLVPVISFFMVLSIIIMQITNSHEFIYFQF